MSSGTKRRRRGDRCESTAVTSMVQTRRLRKLSTEPCTTPPEKMKHFTGLTQSNFGARPRKISRP